MAGVFAGATELLATIDDSGIVRQIRMQLAPDAVLETVVARLTELHGPPTSRTDLPPDSPMPTMVIWSAPMITTSLWLNRSTGRVSVIMRDPAARE